MIRKNIIPYILALCGIVMLQSHAETATYRFPEIKEGSIKIDTINEGVSGKFVSVAIDGYTHRWEDGEPMIPVRFQTIKVPGQTVGYKATIKSSRQSGSIRLGHPLIPGRLIPTDGSRAVDHPYRMSGKGYMEMPSGPKVRIENDFYANGTEHYIVVSTTPFVYDCVENALDIYSDIEIELTYERMQPDDPAWEIVSIPVPTLFDLSGKGEILEMSSGGKISPLFIRTKALMESDQTNTSLSDYLILVPENLKDACEDLVTWKKMKGYNVDLVTFEDIYNSQEFAIGANVKCFDRASSVREWLKSYLENKQKLFYCLIVGDENTSAPSRKFHQSGAIVYLPTEEAIIPSDIYFSDLTSEWNYKSHQCGIYTINYALAHYSPKIPVGRLICSEEEEIRNYVRKLLIYEIYPGYGDMDYLNRGVRIQHPDNFRTGESDKSIFKYLPDIDLINIKGNIDTDYQHLKPTTAEIIEELSKSGLYTFQTHGAPLGLKISSVSGTYDGTHILPLSEYYNLFSTGMIHAENIGFDKLGNSNKPAIAYSLACDVASWDDIAALNNDTIVRLNPEKYNPASAFTVAGNFGGVAFLGNSRAGYFGASKDLEELFSYCLQQNNGLGVIENNSKINYYGRYSPKDLVFKHNLIGDPDIKVWLKKPESLYIIHNSTNTLLTLSSGFLRTGEIGIYCENKNTLFPYQVTNGNLTIPLSYLKDGNGNLLGTVSIRQQGYLPYMQLLSDGALLNNYKSDFILKELLLEKKEGSFLMPVLNLGENCQIKIKALSDITSNEGISVGDNSILTLKSDTKIKLTGDKVSSGGHLDIQAKEVELGIGFTLSEGAEFRINSK